VRALALLAVPVVLLASACSGSGAARDVTIDLRITVWPDGKEAGKPRGDWRLQCSPLGGDLPHGDRACFRLASLRRPLAPVSKKAACSQVYGGPDVAHVVGSLRGRRVDATFRRTDGCQIARWDRVDFLFPKRP
jgi:Subtilisin inhibitor-like